MFYIKKSYHKQTTNLLTNKHINIQFISNTLYIKSNPSNINISKLLTTNLIKFKTIK
jgi:hypothetical protein